MARRTTKKAAAKKKTAKKSAKVARKAAPKAANRANSARRGPRTRVATKPAFLAGGNPQIAKADEAQMATWTRQAAAPPG